MYKKSNRGRCTLLATGENALARWCKLSKKAKQAAIDGTLRAWYPLHIQIARNYAYCLETSD